MADYKVGNLQIVFDAVDETSKSFDNLAKNLKAVQKAIAKIGDTDLKPFVANIKQITKSFTPLLTNISGASEGIIALNQSIQKVGAKNLSKVAEELANISQIPQDTAKAIDEANIKIGEGSEDLHKTEVAYNGIAKAQSQVEITAKRLAVALSTHTYDRLSSSVSSLASQWKNLYATMQKSGMYDRLTGGLFSESASDKLKQITQEYLAQKKAADAVNEAFKRMTMTTQELVIYDYQLLVAEKQKEIQFRQVMIATGQAGDKTNQYKNEISNLQKELSKLQKPLKNSASGFQKIFNSVKRIGLYRLIRTIFSSITGSLKEGVSSLANFDKGFNQTMSQITTSLTVIKTSLGSIVMPILTAIAPVLQQISVGFANLGNVINASMAKMQGLATYTKINTDKLLEYGKASKGVLLDFDKFRSLGGQEDSILSEESIESLNEELGNTKWQYQGIYFLIQSIGELIGKVLKLVNQIANSTAFRTIVGVISWVVGGLIKVVNWILEIIDKSNLIEPILWEIFAVLVAIGAIEFIKWIKSGALIKLLAQIPTLLNKIKASLSSVNSAMVALGIAIVAVTAAVQILSNWDEFSRGTKIAITVVSGLISILGILFVTIMAVKGAFKGVAGVVTGIGLGIAALAAGIVSVGGMIKGYAEPIAKANGGVVPSGTLFYAGEAGAETVTVGSSGRTEVTNVQQMEQALYNALVRFSNQNRGVDGGAININIDGQKVFEATRRTANKRGLDFSRI